MKIVWLGSCRATVRADEEQGLEDGSGLWGYLMGLYFGVWCVRPQRKWLGQRGNCGNHEQWDFGKRGSDAGWAQGGCDGHNNERNSNDNSGRSKELPLRLARWRRGLVAGSLRTVGLWVLKTQLCLVETRSWGELPPEGKWRWGLKEKIFRTQEPR